MNRPDESDPRPAERARLLGIAYRMLGGVHDADDAVQEAFLRWERLAPQDRHEIRNPAAWLTTVLGRICLDHLGTARARRERYTGVWLPEPIPGRGEALPPLVANRVSCHSPLVPFSGVESPESEPAAVFGAPGFDGAV